MDVKLIKPFSRSYFENEDILTLSKSLLGHYLISNINRQLCITTIVETEAYKAPNDKGSHAYGNKRTNRTEVMFVMESMK